MVLIESKADLKEGTRMMNKFTPADTIEEMQKLSRYAEILRTPDEFFHHMNGHTTELSLVLSAFSLSQNAENIIRALEKQEPKKCMDLPHITDEVTYCPTCKTHLMIEPLTRYCRWCGQKLDWD